LLFRVHDKVAHDSSYDQVERGEEETVVSEVVKADKGGLHELATGQENQAAMVLRTFAEIDRQRHTYAENKQVAPENGEKRRYVLVRTVISKRLRRVHCHCPRTTMIGTSPALA
jgi:hypothetical protein